MVRTAVVDSWGQITVRLFLSRLGGGLEYRVYGILHRRNKLRLRFAWRRDGPFGDRAGIVARQGSLNFRIVTRRSGIFVGLHGADYVGHRSESAFPVLRLIEGVARIRQAWVQLVNELR